MHKFGKRKEYHQYLDTQYVQPEHQWIWVDHAVIGQVPGEHGDFDIQSFGADGQRGGEDNNADINSWD